jgi:hypothetical protein
MSRLGPVICEAGLGSKCLEQLNIKEVMLNLLIISFELFSNLIYFREILYRERIKQIPKL